jgi:hypothetical protein
VKAYSESSRDRTPLGRRRGDIYRQRALAKAEYQLAQLNVARMLEPIDSPALAGFVEALEPFNALADKKSGVRLAP